MQPTSNGRFTVIPQEQPGEGDTSCFCPADTFIKKCCIFLGFCSELCWNANINCLTSRSPDPWVYLGLLANMGRDSSSLPSQPHDHLQCRRSKGFSCLKILIQDISNPSCWRLWSVPTWSSWWPPIGWPRPCRYPSLPWSPWSLSKWSLEIIWHLFRVIKVQGQKILRA